MIDVAKLRKVHAMTASANAHEAKVAWLKVDGILSAAGKTRRHLKALLAETKVEAVKPAQGSGFNPFAGFDDYMEEREPGYRARTARERAEKRQREKDELAALLRHHGSEEALAADNPMQAAIEASVDHLKRRVMYQFANGLHETNSLDGWTGGIFLASEIPPGVRSCIEGALPLPRTVFEAKAEWDAWQARSRELELLWDRIGDDCLSIACAARCEIVRTMFWADLPAQSLEEVVLRQREILGAQGCEASGSAERILADLEALAGQDEARSAAPLNAATVPPEADGLDAPWGTPKEQAIGWAKGWNACRAEMMKGGGHG